MKNIKDKSFKLNIGGADEQDLEQALKESMEMYNQQNKFAVPAKKGDNEGGKEEDEEGEEPEEEKFKPF